jgi:N-acetyl-anhydromuramyl-L-alanine amidase AmpD
MKKILFLIITFNLSASCFAFSAIHPASKPSKVFSQTARPKIISRKKWKAKDAVGKVNEHTVRFVTIHHTATRQNEKIPIEQKMQNLQNFSQREDRLASGKLKPAWFDIPYHYYIAVDGKIAEGREIKFVGDTNTEYDPSGHALVVLEGNFEIEQPSAKQQEALQELIAWLSAKWKVPASEIKAHNDYAATACPGQNLKKMLPELRQKVGENKPSSEKP